VTFGATEKKLLNRLRKAQTLTDDQLARAEKHAAASDGSLRHALLDLKLLGERDIARHYARANGADFLDLDNFEPNILVLEYLAPDQAHQYRAIPVGLIDETLVLAVDDIDDVLAHDELRNVVPRALRIVLATNTAISRALEKYYPPEPAPARRDAPRLSPSETRNVQLSQSALRGSSGEIAKPRLLAEEPLSGRPTRVVSLSDIETVMEKEDSDRVTQMMSRAEDYLDEPREDARLDEQGLASDDLEGAGGGADPRVEEILRAMLDTALVNRAEEIEFPMPTSGQSRTRLRREGSWHDSIPYLARYHDPLIRRMQELSGIEGSTERAVEGHFLLESRRGRIPSIACFTPTTRGVRCVIRFPENIPLLQSPLKALGLEDSVERDFERRLGGEGGGLLLVTSGMARLAHQIYASILLDQRGKERSVHSIEWTMDRRLPGVAQVEARTVDAIIEAIDHSAREAPELIGISAIPTGDVVGRLIDVASRGQAVIGCLTAPTAAHGLAALRAARTDAMAQTLGVIAHVHARRVPRLCPSCRGALPENKIPRGLPDWAKEIDPALLKDSTGCPVCAGTGRKGVHWICDINRPGTSGDGAYENVQTADARLAELIAKGEVCITDAV